MRYRNMIAHIFMEEYMNNNEEKKKELIERIKKARKKIEEYKCNNKPCLTIKDKQEKTIKEFNINILEKYLDKLKKGIDILQEKEIHNYEECLENIEIIISVFFGEMKIIINVLNKSLQLKPNKLPKPQPSKQNKNQSKKPKKKKGM
jgi:predicted ATPase